MMRLMLATALGALAAMAALWPQGWLFALACSPLGGSAAALLLVVAATVFAKGDDVLRPGERDRRSANLAVHGQSSLASE